MQLAIGGTLRLILSDTAYDVTLTGGRITSDAAIAAALPIAAVLGEALEAQPASPELVANTGAILELYESWGWGCRVSVSAPARVGEPASGIGVFFSGGVDSTYSALTHPEVTHLIYVLNYDVSPKSTRLRPAVIAQLYRAAEALGKDVILLETDLRNFSDRYISWERYHGAALAFAAHCCKEVIGKVFIPSTHTHDDDFPWGSHPQLDHLWSSEDLKVVHDAADVSRTDKTAFIADNPEALEWLRVCWLSKDGSYNCGHCEKCLRTMVTLEALGKAAPSFPELDVSLVGKQRFRNPNSLAFANEVVALLEKTDRPDLLGAMRKALMLSRIPSPRESAVQVRDRVRLVIRRAQRTRKSAAAP